MSRTSHHRRRPKDVDPYLIPRKYHVGYVWDFASRYTVALSKQLKDFEKSTRYLRRRLYRQNGDLQIGTDYLDLRGAKTKVLLQIRDEIIKVFGRPDPL